MIEGFSSSYKFIDKLSSIMFMEILIGGIRIILIWKEEMKKLQFSLWHKARFSHVGIYATFTHALKGWGMIYIEHVLFGDNALCLKCIQKQDTLIRYLKSGIYFMSYGRLVLKYILCMSRKERKRVHCHKYAFE